MKYSDNNLFFNGTKNVYNVRDYIRGRSDSARHVVCPMKKQFLSKEDEDACFMIKNRDLVDPTMRKTESDVYQIGKLLE